VRYKITSAKTAAASLGCERQFIGGHEMTCRGHLSWIAGLIKIMLVRGTSVQYGTESQRHQGRRGSCGKRERFLDSMEDIIPWVESRKARFFAVTAAKNAPKW
jgi:hypothetical protein